MVAISGNRHVASTGEGAAEYLRRLEELDLPETAYKLLKSCFMCCVLEALHRFGPAAFRQLLSGLKVKPHLIHDNDFRKKKQLVLASFVELHVLVSNGLTGLKAVYDIGPTGLVLTPYVSDFLAFLREIRQLKIQKAEATIHKTVSEIEMIDSVSSPAESSDSDIENEEDGEDCRFQSCEGHWPQLEEGRI